jgi:hypothetical protein
MQDIVGARLVYPVRAPPVPAKHPRPTRFTIRLLDTAQWNPSQARNIAFYPTRLYLGFCSAHQMKISYLSSTETL